MLLQIPQILNQQLTSELRSALQRIEWTPVINKENNHNNNPNNVINFFQLPEQSIEAKYFAGQIISAVENSPLFISSSLPKKIYPPIFRKFCENQGYSTRIYNAVKQIPGMPIRVRLDLSATIFLSDPNEYEGGELVIEDNYGTQQIKLPASHLILYPSTSLHYLKPVKNGNRITATFHVESMVRDDLKRTILFDMDNSIRSMIDNENLHREVSNFTGIYHNLLRMWSDV